jgi:hypothetical protein
MRDVVRREVMKIVWRNQKKITRKSVSVVSIGGLEEPGLVQRFFRSSSGVGILETRFELLVTSRKSEHAA